MKTMTLRGAEGLLLQLGASASRLPLPQALICLDPRKESAGRLGAPRDARGVRGTTSAGPLSPLRPVAMGEHAEEAGRWPGDRTFLILLWQEPGGCQGHSLLYTGGRMCHAEHCPGSSASRSEALLEQPSVVGDRAPSPRALVLSGCALWWPVRLKVLFQNLQQRLCYKAHSR